MPILRGRGASVRDAYDADSRLSSQVDPLGNTTQFAYDAAGNETWTQNAMGYTSVMQYDGNNRLTYATDADGRHESYGYDAMGNMTQNIWYDASNTPLETISMAYDANRNLTQASNPQGTYTLSYNPLNQITQVVESAVGVTLNMAYDARGNRTLLSDNLGASTQNTYDTANELTKELYTESGTTLLVENSYDWQGRIASEKRYSDSAGTTLVAETDYSYNADGQLTDLYEGNSSQIANYSLTYDADHELIQQVDHGVLTPYLYDVLGQLTTFGATTQSYDANGNQTGTTLAAGNEVTYDGNYTYGYDHQGNETAMYQSGGTTWAFAYDNQNHMLLAIEENPGGTILTEVDYKYDAFGNMTERDQISSGTTTIAKYVLDGWNPAKQNATGMSGWSTIADLNSGGTLVSHYVLGDNVDQVIARVDTTLAADPAGIYNLFIDYQRSVRDIADSTGTVVDTVNYDAFGKVLNLGSNPNYVGHYTYASYDYDTATDFCFNHARVYDPVTQRWLSQDPLGFDAGDNNLYRYVRNAPTDAVDPSGMDGPVVPGAWGYLDWRNWRDIATLHGWEMGTGMEHASFTLAYF